MRAKIVTVYCDFICRYLILEEAGNLAILVSRDHFVIIEHFNFDTGPTSTSIITDGEIEIPEEIAQKIIEYAQRNRSAFDILSPDIKNIIESVPIKKPVASDELLKEFELMFQRDASMWQRFKNWCSRRFSVN